MNSVLANVNSRLVPGLLPSLGGLYPEILGPLYRFDLNLKKTDWFLDQTEVFDEQALKELDSYIEILQNSSEFIENDRADILYSWDDYYTYEQRIKKLEEIVKFRSELLIGDSPIVKPDFKEYLDSKDFKRAYQCYSCHKPTGLNN